jgi:PAS domain S-box-containing protein
MRTNIRERTQGAMLREELLCEEADFRTLAEAIAGAIFISQGKRLHYVNHAAEIITGYARKELLSMNFWDLVHPDSRELIRDRQRVRQEQIVVRTQSEVKILANRGEERWLDIRTGIIEFDGVLSSLVSGFDVTDRKKAQEQLQLLTVTDPLTGLGNYRRLVETLETVSIHRFPRASAWLSFPRTAKRLKHCCARQIASCTG